MTRSGRTKAGLAAAGLCLPLVLIGCSSTPEVSTAPTTSSTAAAPVNQGADITIREFEYLPGDATIKANQTVTWANDGSAKHTVTADKDQAIDFKSETLANGGKFVQSFSAPGTYKYFCSVHPDKMRGTITVTS